MISKTEDKHTFFAACIMIFILRMEWGIATSMLPIYVHELGGSPLEVGLTFTLFAGIFTFAAPLWGACSDRIGRRKILMTFGMLGLVPIFLIMSFQENPLTLTLLRGSTAIFVGAIVPSTWALVSDISPPQDIGKNMGIIRFFEMGGFALGPINGGFIADSFGFSILWVYVAVICLIGGLAFFLRGRDPAGLKKNAKKPLFFEVLRNREIRPKILALSAAFSIFLLGYALVGPNYSVYLVNNLGFSKTGVGTIFFTGTVVSAVVLPIVGSGSDKYGRKWFFVIGSLGLPFGNLLLFLARDLPFVFLAWTLISSYELFQLIGSAYIADFVSQEEKAFALGFFNSAGSLTRSLGAVVGGLVISAISTHTLILVSTLFPPLSIAVISLLLGKKACARDHTFHIQERNMHAK